MLKFKLKIELLRSLKRISIVLILLQMICEGSAQTSCLKCRQLNRRNGEKSQQKLCKCQKLEISPPKLIENEHDEMPMGSVKSEAISVQILKKDKSVIVRDDVRSSEPVISMADQKKRFLSEMKVYLNDVLINDNSIPIDQLQSNGSALECRSQDAVNELRWKIQGRLINRRCRDKSVQINSKDIEKYLNGREWSLIQVECEAIDDRKWNKSLCTTLINDGWKMSSTNEFEDPDRKSNLQQIILICILVAMLIALLILIVLASIILCMCWRFFKPNRETQLTTAEQTQNIDTQVVDV